MAFALTDLRGDVGALLATAPDAATWTTALGGSNDPVSIARGSNVTVDVNFSGGTAPTADYTLLIYYLPSAD